MYVETIPWHHLAIVGPIIYLPVPVVMGNTDPGYAGDRAMEGDKVPGY